MIALQRCRQWQTLSKYAHVNTLLHRLARPDGSRALPWLKLFLVRIYWRDRQSCAIVAASRPHPFFQQKVLTPVS